MKIRWMRFWDYWIGRSVCFLLSIYPVIKDTLSKGKISIKQPESVLFIKLFGIGSIVLSYPAVASFKKSYPRSRLYYITFSANREIVEILQMVDNDKIITIRDDSVSHLITDVFAALRFFRAEKIQCTVDFEFFSRFTAIFALFTGASYRVGFFNYNTEGLSRGRTINIPVAYNYTKHTSQVFLHLANKLGAGDEVKNLPSIFIDYNLHEQIKDFEKKIIFNINSSDMINLRNWPLEKFARLAEMILDRFEKTAIIFIGTQIDTTNVRKVIRLIRDGKKDKRVFDLAGKTSLKELIGLFNRSDILITVDSGPAHVASLTDIKIIIMFGPETPALYHPIGKNSKNIYLDMACQPCVSVFNGKRSHCTNNICMQRIRVEDVFNCIT